MPRKGAAIVAALKNGGILMTVEIKTKLPLGRSFEEYIQMFNLNANDLSKSIIGCGDGLSSFNKRMKELGYNIISCDPIYIKSIDQMNQYMLESKEEVIQQPRNKLEDIFWNFNQRRTFINEFLDDYELGKQEGRYLSCSLPELPFKDKEFDIALCSHFLFTYKDLGFDFHYNSIQEMLRVAKEIRIFPIIDLHCEKSEFLEPIVEELKKQCYRVEITKVEYGFYLNGHDMLLIHDKK